MYFEMKGICTFSSGVATAGSENTLGHSSSAQECANMVIQKMPTANGVTWDTATEECFAEFEATSIGPDPFASLQTCIFDD